MDAIERAGQAIADGLIGVAIDAALEAWRIHRTADIGAVITWLESQTDYIKPFEDAELFHAQWLSQAKEVRNSRRRGWLCATLSQRLPDSATLRPLGEEPILARLAALNESETDPRIADAALRLVKRGRVGDVRVFEHCSALFVRHGDRRHSKELRKLIVDRRKRRIDRLEADALHIAAFKLDRVARAGDADEPWWDLLPPPPPGRDDETRAAAAKIIDALYDDPFNEELRSVCTDQLLELGDPLGEFIALQQVAKPDSDTKRRIRELQSAHQEEWLGPDLSSVLSSVRFRDGLPIHATLESSVKDSIWERALEDKRIATIEVVHRGKSPRYRHQEFRDAIDAFWEEE